ncbi:MAG: hypothetical protein AAFO91_20255, partial [Bacteroidota bacterium]
MSGIVMPNVDIDMDDTLSVSSDYISKHWQLRTTVEISGGGEKVQSNVLLHTSSPINMISLSQLKQLYLDEKDVVFTLASKSIRDTHSSPESVVLRSKIRKFGNTEQEMADDGGLRRCSVTTDCKSLGLALLKVTIDGRDYRVKFHVFLRLSYEARQEFGNTGEHWLGATLGWNFLSRFATISMLIRPLMDEHDITLDGVLMGKGRVILPGVSVANENGQRHLMENSCAVDTGSLHNLINGRTALRLGLVSRLVDRDEVDSSSLQELPDCTRACDVSQI